MISSRKTVNHLETSDNPVRSANDQCIKYNNSQHWQLLYSNQHTGINSNQPPLLDLKTSKIAAEIQNCLMKTFTYNIWYLNIIFYNIYIQLTNFCSKILEPWSKVECRLVFHRTQCKKICRRNWKCKKAKNL